MKIIVLAGNHGQYQLYVKCQQQSTDEFIYVTNVRDAYATSASALVVVGTFWERLDAFKLYSVAKTRVRA